MSIHWNWRLASRLSVIILAVLVVALIAVVQQRNAMPSATTSANAAGLQGTDLGGTAAPDFRLTDQYGKQISLSQFKGKPVVLGFLYTHCPDICPLTAEKLHATLQDLGKNAQNVAVLAVSTDPARDTQNAALTFSQQHNMQDEWHFLIGSQNTLSPIWSGYNIFVQTQKGMVDHSTGLYIIDKQGKQRVFLDNDFTPSQLSADLQKLLQE